MTNKNPRKWRFTWEAQSHSPTLRLFLFDSHTIPSNQCHDLKVDLNLSQSHVSISWIQQPDSQNHFSLTVPVPKVLIDPESPASFRALSDHIEVKLLLLLPVDHPIVSSFDSVLHLTEEEAKFAEPDVSTPLVMDYDLKSLLSKEEGVHFYCRSCSTQLTRRPIRHCVEMPSVNWQESADNWFGGCCCSFGGIGEKLVTSYAIAKSYICVTEMCLLTHATVTVFKDDLVECKFPEWDEGQKYQGETDFTVEDGSTESSVDSLSNNERIACRDNQSDMMHDSDGKSRSLCLKYEKNLIADNKCEVNAESINVNSLFHTLSLSESSETLSPVAGCCVHTECEILDHVDKTCSHTLSESSPAYQKTMRTMELLADQRSFLNGFLGNIFMARSFNLSKDVEWIEFLCPQCSSLLGAYPCINGIAPIDGGVRLFKCYISTHLPVGGSGDMFRKYTLEKMFTNQLLESATEELSFRTVVRDLKNKSPMVQIVLLNPNSWCCTGYCLGSDSSVGSTGKLDLHPKIKVLFSDCRNNSESELRTLEGWLRKNLADEVFMLLPQIDELIEVLASAKDILPPSFTSIQGLPLSSLMR
ncbi:hypothetical protein LWI28_004666 [Acer negundo]|uniref:Ubiquitin-conjugating enzyme E2C-binding protein n=1 Tax=Acer negundo TaxID=4023 RepID=A0AAD5NL95_ACENE|nr:hypothetical protein LWI28_004666 [Acer negundo]